MGWPGRVSPLQDHVVGEPCRVCGANVQFIGVVRQMPSGLPVGYILQPCGHVVHGLWLFKVKHD
jgi:hypothetical protein